jgi:hypothetical protein
MLALMELSAKPLEEIRKIVAIDSFLGFPPGSSQDSDQFNPESKSIYKQFTPDFVRMNLQRAGLPAIDAQHLSLVQGWIPEVLGTLDLDEISILHLDLDLYHPYLSSLRVLWNKLLPGAIVLIDEYDGPGDSDKWPGARVAVDQFASERGLSVLRHWTGFRHLIKS